MISRQFPAINWKSWSRIVPDSIASVSTSDGAFAFAGRMEMHTMSKLWIITRSNYVC